MLVRICISVRPHSYLLRTSQTGMSSSQSGSSKVTPCHSLEHVNKNGYLQLLSLQRNFYTAKKWKMKSGRQQRQIIRFNSATNWTTLYMCRVFLFLFLFSVIWRYQPECLINLFSISALSLMYFSISSLSFPPPLFPCTLWMCICSTEKIYN